MRAVSGATVRVLLSVTVLGYLAIIIASPLQADERSQRRLLDKTAWVHGACAS